MISRRVGGFAKTLAAILALLMCAIAFVSCANGSGNTTDAPSGDGTSASPAGSGDQTAPETEPPVLTDEYGRPIEEDGLPAEADLGGRTFTVHTRGNVDQYEWTAEDQNGEVLHDAIYKRNTNVEERFKIDINVIAEGTWSDYGTNLEKVKASIKSGDGAYDLLCGYSTPIASMATSGLIYNLRNVSAINFDKPWWSRGFTDEFTIDGATFFGAGSLSIAMIYSMECIFFNTSIMSEVDQSYNIYKTVQNLEWTWDEMIRVGQLAYVPDASGTRGAGTRFGFCCRENNNNGNALTGFLYSTGIKLVQRDNEGNLILNEDLDRLSTIVDKEQILLFDTPSNFPLDLAEKLDFKEETSLFCFTWLYYGQTDFAKTMDNYGVVPMPMFDKDQGRYYTPVQGGLHMYAIPNDTPKDENGMITEALAAESYRVLMPAYYEVILKTRYAKDSQTSEMIDIMYDTVTFDIGNTYNSLISYLGAVQAAVRSRTPGQVSTIRSTLKQAQKNLDEFVKGVKQHKSD